MRLAILRVGRALSDGLMTNHSCGDAIFSADAYLRNCMECSEMY